jgi:hypothetical protein
MFADSHHVLPRSKGGTEGPEVDLCQDCHRLIHTCAKAMKRGKSPDLMLAELDEEARGRAMGLIQVILMGDLHQPTNPNPMIAAVLEDPLYLKALKLFQRDSGFTSQEAAINGLLRKIAEKYGLVSETPQSKKPMSIKHLRR